MIPPCSVKRVTRSYRYSDSSFVTSNLREGFGLALDLLVVFMEISRDHFDNFLDPPQLTWNSRLRVSAGRFIPGSRKWAQRFPARIEIAQYLLEEKNSIELIYDTLAHESIHYWLWLRRRPYGHTPEFLRKMKEMGVSRYNPVPRLRPYKYFYYCHQCQKRFPARKRLGFLACAGCCEQYSNGQYDARFKLVLEGCSVTSTESPCA